MKTPLLRGIAFPLLAFPFELGYRNLIIKPEKYHTMPRDPSKPPFTIIENDHPVRQVGDDPAAEMPEPDNDEGIELKIRMLEEEHRDLDTAIHMMEVRMPYDRITLQRMKKRKLALKDKISELREKILPDIIA